MNASYLLAALAYLLPTFPLGYFWHLRTFEKQYAALDVYRRDMIIPFGLLSMTVQALLYAWLYPRLFDTAHGAWLGSAAQFALVFGVLAWSLATLPVAAKNRMTSVRDFMMLETAFTALQYIVVSPLIALAWRSAA